MKRKPEMPAPKTGKETGTDIPKKKKAGPMRLAMRRLMRNPSAIMGFIVLGIIVFIAVFASLLIPYDPAQINMAQRMKGPSLEHWFGTDQYGRDILSRVFVGAKYSLMLGLLNTSISCFMGMIIGSLCGFFGGKVDLIVMRLMEIVQSIPGMLLAVVIAAVLGPGFWQVIIAIGIAGTPGFTRMTRASIMMVRSTEYIEAAALINCSTLRIIVRHAMPNAFSPILVQSTMSIATCITMAAAISFIGLGVQPPTPEWGAMLAGARDQVREYPYLLIAPGAMIMLSVLSINMIGDALRDVLDPKLRK
jgi:peptide/nickel transport system permease protein